MNKSTHLVKRFKNLSEMQTWQSGILQSTVNRSTRRLSDNFLKKYSLSTMHWFIIGAILETGNAGIRITDLADKVGTTLGYLTNAVNNLEFRGMVVRTDHATDSRTKILTIAEGFREECNEIEAGLRDIFRTELYKKVSREELATYIEVVQKLAKL